jgi:inner membrane protein
MATMPAHAVVGMVTAGAVGGPRSTRRLALAGAVCAALPDLDVLLMRYGDVAYADPWGHRGISHGLLFAAGLGALCGAIFFRRTPPGFARAALALTLATATQGLLDAMTTGGLGVAFLAPLDHTRFFLPWRPIPVAPLSVAAMFSDRGLHLLLWEVAFLVLPALAVFAIVLRRRRTAPELSSPAS